MDALVNGMIAAMRARIDAARLDESGHQGEGAGEAREDDGQDRLSEASGATTRPLTMAADDLYGNAERAFALQLELRASRGSNKPVDKTEWDMTPQTVNDYYNPHENEIVFPAAHPAAAVLRPEGRSGGQLRRHRRHHRPRDDPRLR